MAKAPAKSAQTTTPDKLPNAPTASKEDLLRFYREMVLIRRFEERAGQLYGMGLIGGFCHLYIGQEAVAVGVQESVKQGHDKIITGYRDHGHMLAAGMDPKEVMAELTGRIGGSSKGKGGSMHMFDVPTGFYGGHGIVGAQVALGTGLAFAQMSDPLRGGTSGVIGQWFYLLFGLLFFTANGHLALISLVVDSYRALPIGAPLPDPHAFFSIAPTFLLTVLRGALTLAIPLTVAMLAVNLAFGVLARAAPALNPIQLGLPVSLLLGLFLLALLAGEMGPPVQRLFDAAFQAADAVTH